MHPTLYTHKEYVIPRLYIDIISLCVLTLARLPFLAFLRDLWGEVVKSGKTTCKDTPKTVKHVCRPPWRYIGT